MTATTMPPPAPRTEPTSVTVRILPDSAIRDIAPIWQALEVAHGGGNIASGWTWTSTWLEHYGDLVPHSFAVGERAGVPCAIALITQGVKQRRGPIPVKTIHIGTAGEPVADTVWVEYNHLLAAPDARDAFAAALCDVLWAAKPRWDELLLDGFAPEDAAPFVQSARGDAFFVRREPCPATDLDAIRAGGREVIEAFGKSTRLSVRRSLRRFGTIETEWAESPAAAAAILDELIELHQRRWTEAGKPGVFASDRFRAFHSALLPRLLAEGRAVMYRVRGDLGTIGCLYAFIENGRVLFYQSGFGHFPEAKVSAGLVAHAVCMQECVDRGYREYNFLQGDARYKRELSTGERSLIWAVASRPGLKRQLLTYARNRKYRDVRLPAANDGIEADADRA